jgi:hypothetical protein
LEKNGTIRKDADTKSERTLEMTELKTKPNPASVTDFLNQITDEQKRQDSFTILEIMKTASGSEPKMWGDSIVGFGSYHYRYASGREGDWFLTGFSPRKQNLTLYIMPGFDDYEALLSNLGKHKTGKSCLYINKLEDVDRLILKELIVKSVQKMKAGNP